MQKLSHPCLLPPSSPGRQGKLVATARRTPSNACSSEHHPGPTSEEAGGGTASHDDAELLEVEDFLSYTREKLYTCMSCGDSFNHKGTLATHQRYRKKEIEAEGCENEGDDDWAPELHN